MLAVYTLPLLTSLLDVTGQLLLVGAYTAVGRVSGGAALAPTASATASAVASATASVVAVVTSVATGR